MCSRSNSSKIRHAGLWLITQRVSSNAFVLGRIEIVSFGYLLVISGAPSSDKPAGGRPIRRFGAVLMSQVYIIIMNSCKIS
jgi:hypothetical protein